MAIQRTNAARERIAKDKEKKDPTVGQLDINRMYDDDTNRYEKVKSEITRLSAIKDPDKNATNQLQELVKQRDYMEEYVLPKKKMTEQGFQAASGREEPRQSVLNREARSANLSVDDKANKAAIDMSRAWVLNANTKYKNDPEKLQDILDKAQGDQYLYEVKEIKDSNGKSLGHRIVLKDDYAYRYGEYLKNSSAKIGTTQFANRPRPQSTPTTPSNPQDQFNNLWNQFYKDSATVKQ